MRSLHFFCVLGLLVCLGCGSKSSRTFREESGVMEEANAPAAAGAVPAVPVPRKIIYSARVDLVVEEFEKAEQDLQKLVEEQQGYVAKSDIEGSPGVQRSGTWTIRIPVEHFNTFREEVAKLGELGHSSTDSDDITDKYYDLKAHIKNDEVAEGGLQKLYTDKAANGRLEDLRAIMEDLRKVRGEIEAEKGQLERWEKETLYSTVTVTIHDRKGYVPPTTPEFSTSIGRTFHDSVQALVSFGKFIVLAVVAVAPWLVALAVVVGLPLWLLIRLFRKSRRSTPPPMLTAEAAPPESEGG